MVRRTLVVAMLGLLLVPAFGNAQVQEFKIDPAHSVVGFKIRHLVSNVSGRFDQFDGTIVIDPQAPQTMTLTGTIQSASIDTNQPDRDKHLRSADFFDVEKFPTITFKSTKVEKAGDSYRVTGDLTMHGVTKPVELEVAVLGFGAGPRGGTIAGFQIDGKINRQDFGVVWNRTLDKGGTMLGDDVTLDLQVEAKVAPQQQPGAAGSK